MPQEPAPRRGTQKRPLLIIAVLLFFGLLAAPIVFRAALLESSLPLLLERQGFQQPRIEVAHVGLNSIRLENLRLGARGQISAQSLDLEFDYGKLFEAPLRRLHVAGLTLKLDPKKDLWDFPYSLDSQAQETQGPQEPPDLRKIPFSEKVSFDGQLEIANPEEPLSGTFQGRLEAVPGKWPQLSFRLKSETVIGSPGASFRVALQSRGSQVTAQVELDDSFAGKSLQLDANLELEEILEKGRIPPERDFSLAGLRVKSDIGFSLSKAATPYGNLDVELPLRARLEAGVLTLKDAGSGILRFWPLPGLLPQEVETAFALDQPDAFLEAQSLAEISLPIANCLENLDRPCPVSSQIELVLSHPEQGPPEIQLNGQTNIAFSQAPAISYQSESLSLIIQQLPLGLAKLESLAMSGDFQGNGAEHWGVFETDAQLTRLTFGPNKADALQVKLAGSFDAKAGRIETSMANSGDASSNSLELKGLQLGSALSARDPLHIALSEAQLTLTTGAGGPVLDYRLRADMGAADFLMHRTGKEPLQLSQRPARLSLSGGWRDGALRDLDADLVLTDLEISPHELNLRNLLLKARQEHDQDEISLAYEADIFDGQKKAKRFFPLSLHGEGKFADRTLNFHGHLHPKGKRDRLAVFSGRHGLEAGSGSMALTSSLPTFAPDGLQPAKLSPLLADLQEVTGTATGKLQLGWRAGVLDGTFTLGLEDLSFRSADLLLHDLAVQLHIDDIFSPHAKAGQRVTFKKVLTPLPIEDFSMSFGLEPGDPAKVAIEDLRFQVMDGEVSLGRTLLDFSDARQNLLFTISGLGLPRIASELAIEGLEAEGALSGRFPVAIDQSGNFRIAEARLAAMTPGKIRFVSEAAVTYLSQAGESAELLLQALENFHYRELVLTLDKSESHDTRLGISLKGRNPDLLDGREFNLNINVESNLGSVFSAISDAYKLSNRLLFHAWTLGR